LLFKRPHELSGGTETKANDRQSTAHLSEVVGG